MILTRIILCVLSAFLNKCGCSRILSISTYGQPRGQIVRVCTHKDRDGSVEDLLKVVKIKWSEPKCPKVQIVDIIVGTENVIKTMFGAMNGQAKFNK